MTTTTTRGVDERSMMVRTTATRALILALTFLLVCSLGVSAAGFSTHPNALNPNVTDQELMNLWGILQDKIKALEAEFERWIAAGNPAANWETSPSGAELATLRKQLANVAEDAARRGFIRFPPEPGSAPPGSRWVRVLRRGMWAWTLARVITSSDPGKEALDVGIGMTCAYAGEVVGTLCFGPVGGVVGGIVGGALAPRVEEFAAGSGGREPEVKPAPPPPPPPVMAAAGPSSFLGGRALTLTVTGGGQEGWIRVTRSCPTGNACDNGRGGFTSQIERGSGMEPLGGSRGTVYVRHAATIQATASLTDGTVPAGHYLKIYWEGWPRDEDPACKATSGSQCTSKRQMAPPGDPHAPIVCAAFGYESGGTNLGDGFQPVCITLAYRD